MVSVTEWIMNMDNYEGSVSTTVNELGCVEITWANSSLWENDVSPEVRIVLDSENRDRLRLPEVNSGNKDGFKANLRERRGGRIVFFHDYWCILSKKNKQKEGNARQKGLPRNCEL